jgi:hypothetical protein
MSQEVTASRNYYKRLAEELAEADTPQARHQAVLDRHWETMREQDEPDDQYFVGGFQEFHSKTPITVTNKYWPRRFEEMAEDPIPTTIINEAAPDNVIALPKSRSLHAVLCGALTNTQALLSRLEAGVTVPRQEQGEIVRLLYVATRHQVKALAAVLELDGLE